MHHQTSSHARSLHSIELKPKVTVPIHTKDLPRGTIANVFRQADITLEEFFYYL
ncbi:type II toxin-antitoxin system HicA family toxin [candidate division KSB1 bacterium]|nr:type II toxin-antitoxin system HicA family toxin [candidate division KSB1 bacterium]